MPADIAPPAPSATPKESAANSAPYTAMVYFHGIGNQRRYEEVSIVIDAMDRLMRKDHDLGRMVIDGPVQEPGRDKPGSRVTFIRGKYTPDPGDKALPWRQVRFYEVYWAPLMNGDSSAWRVVKWIGRQALRPIRTLRATWADHHRLHRASLVDLIECGGGLAGAEPGDAERLLQVYDDFDGREARKTPEQGMFPAFLEALGKEKERAPGDNARLAGLACAWHRHYRRTEMMNGLVLITALLAILLVAGGLLGLTYRGLHAFAGLTEASAGAAGWVKSISGYLKADLTTTLGFLVTALSAFGLKRALETYVGDVEAWSTYEETDEKYRKRREVIDTGEGVLAHVLKDPRCERVIVVSHSSGTSIAQDTLLALRRRNMLAGVADPLKGEVPLGKIRHLVTMASPVDKINYFFEAWKTNSFRYGKVIEELRGDILDVPFSTVGGQPHIHWVNFWDEADVISGPLHSPVGRTSLKHLVDNVHVPSLRFPSPGAAHAAYFTNGRVIRGLVEMMLQDRYSFAHLMAGPGTAGKDYRGTFLGPGDPCGQYRAFGVLALLVPWLTLGAVASYLLHWPAAGIILGGAAAALALALVLGRMLGGWVPQKGRI
jgi:hypothetical protein